MEINAGKRISSQGSIRKFTAPQIYFVLAA